MTHFFNKFQVWNHQLANLAQQFANNCSDKHNKKRHTPPFTGVGENLFFSGGFSFVNGKKVPGKIVLLIFCGKVIKL